MKRLASILVLFAVCLPALAQVYLYNPTNSPGLAGQQAFTTGIPGYYYWGWGTNAQSSNATVVAASPSIGITTNGFAYTPFWSAAMTNWLNSLLVAATNNALIVATNNDLAVSNKLWLQITNGYVIAGANVTVTTNASGQTISYTIASTGGGSTTNVFIAAGANVTVTTNVVGSSTIYTIAASSGAGIAAAAGVDMLLTTNAGVVTFNFNTTATNVTSIAFTGGGVINGTFPPGTMLSDSNSLKSAGGTFVLDTNGIPGTMDFVRNTTNQYMPVINAKAYGLTTVGDQTANLQLAIDAATNSGSRVFVPAGDYTVNGPLHVGRNASGMILEGEAAQYANLPQGTSFRSSSANPVIIIDGVGTAIKNIGFLGGGAANGTIGIMSRTNDVNTPITDVLIQNCRFYALKSGIQASNAWNWLVLNSYWDNCTYGILASNEVNRIRVLDGHFGACIYGINLEGGSANFTACANWVIDSTFESCSNAVRLIGLQTEKTMISCYFEGNTNDIMINGAASTTIKDCFHGVTGGGTNIVMVGAKSVSIQSPWFADGSIAMNADATTYGLMSLNSWVAGSSGVAFQAPITSLRYDGTNFVLNGGSYYGNGTGVSNVVSSVVTNGGFSLNQIARSNIVDQIQTWPTSTNQLVAIPGSTSWLIQSATPTAQTNISGTLSATQWIFQSLVVSNNTAAAFTNWITIPAAKAVGYAATNDAAVLGFNGCIVPASSYVELLYKIRLGQTNYAVVNP